MLGMQCDGAPERFWWHNVLSGLRVLPEWARALHVRVWRPRHQQFSNGRCWMRAYEKRGDVVVCVKLYTERRVGSGKPDTEEQSQGNKSTTSAPAACHSVVL